MSDEAFDKIKQFVYRERGKYKFPLLRTTKVEVELGMAGDDAVEFILAYGKEFNVDVSNFMLADYFSGEGFSLLRLFQRKEKNKSKELTLGDLEKGILAGKLDEGVINQTTS